MDLPGFWAGPRRPRSAKKAGGTLQGHGTGGTRLSGDAAEPSPDGAPRGEVRVKSLMCSLGAGAGRT